VLAAVEAAAPPSAVGKSSEFKLEGDENCIRAGPNEVSTSVDDAFDDTRTPADSASALAFTADEVEAKTAVALPVILDLPAV
jgi:hypothetical protein